ncbi:alpha/beta fold hydrolase [Streptomyces sp. AV19]|uniref:alpha/beta fold hydrolase n=1 Tax=Streptomyces sp. AV19 TaxID=2793068 RepID=UPI0024132A0F|nr:alpha/beta fold hydrolase [Streptomyces sp. AV19]MDG4536605.1 alpha/beta hydrolase [Streptomyces sp. AV19]
MAESAEKAESTEKAENVQTVSFPVDTPSGRRRAEVAYRRTGAGEPLVLLHGIGHHLQGWDPVLEILAAEHEVIALDLPGFGRSPALPAGHPYDLPSTVSALRACFEALELDRPHIAGNSLGGLLALQLGQDKLARTVTALSPAGFWTEAERRWAFGVLRGMRATARRLPPERMARLAATAAGRTAMGCWVYARPARRAPESLVAETMALREATGFEATLAAGRSVLFTHEVAGLPVTIAWGDRDRLLLPRQGVRAKKVVPGARLVRLPGCGHIPMSDDPALVARVILDTAR